MDTATTGSSLACFSKSGHSYVTTSVNYRGRVFPPDVYNAATALLNMRYGAQNESCMAPMVSSPNSSRVPVPSPPSFGPRVSPSNSPSMIPSESPPATPLQGQQQQQARQPTQQRQRQRRAPPRQVTGEDGNFIALPDKSPPLATLDTTPMKLVAKWGGKALDLSTDEHRDKLHSSELRVAAELRLSCATYLASKRRIFHAKSKQIGRFKKTHAQQACKIDVNKASKLYEAFMSAGWVNDDEGPDEGPNEVPDEAADEL